MPRRLCIFYIWISYCKVMFHFSRLLFSNENLYMLHGLNLWYLFFTFILIWIWARLGHSQSLLLLYSFDTLFKCMWGELTNNLTFLISPHFSLTFTSLLRSLFVVSAFISFDLPPTIPNNLPFLFLCLYLAIYICICIYVCKSVWSFYCVFRRLNWCIYM